jgi:hypothetical protein
MSLANAHVQPGPKPKRAMPPPQNNSMKAFIFAGTLGTGPLVIRKKTGKNRAPRS